MLLDLHVHTEFGSDCSEFSLDELREAIVSWGMSTVVITDHWTTKAAPELRSMLGDHACTVIVGMEITTEYGDFVVFSEDEAALAAVAPEGVKMQFGDAVAAGIVAPHNAIIWVHPCHPTMGAPAADVLPPDEQASIVQAIDAIEGINGRNQREQVDWDMASGPPPDWRAVQIAQRWNLPITCSSDSHSARSFHTVTTEFDCEITSAAELIAAIKQNRIVPTHQSYFDAL